MRSILYIDVEGGRGGSSRSLRVMSGNLDSRRFRPVIALREHGSSEEFYKSKNVSHFVFPEMPAFRPSERKNILSFLIFLKDVAVFSRKYSKFLNIVRRENVSMVHVNHEGMALFGRWLAGRLNVPWICHLRCIYPENPWSRWLYGVIDQADARIFISENEQEHFEKMIGKRADCKNNIVINNIAPEECFENRPLAHDGVAGEFLRVASLTNFDYGRGVDRILDVARILKSMGRKDIRFYIYGKDSRVSGWSMSFEEFLRQEIEEYELEEFVNLREHSSEPEKILAQSDVLVRLRRQNNPWGRDVIEAMASGLPVVSIGNYEGFIESGRGGFIEREFDPKSVADIFVKLREDVRLCGEMGIFNQRKAARMFRGSVNIVMIERLYKDIIEEKNVGYFVKEQQ
ncbi:MAG TPA: glycosyltransferase family 4 protein [Kaistiaceae bacterium]|nr:glycosyltransferase family 4 protein [Kaistiaceae bacterium]